MSEHIVPGLQCVNKDTRTLTNKMTQHALVLPCVPCRIYNNKVECKRGYLRYVALVMFVTGVVLYLRVYMAEEESPAQVVDQLITRAMKALSTYKAQLIDLEQQALFSISESCVVQQNLTPQIFHHVWYIARDSYKAVIAIYGAYLDDRDNVGSRILVRITGVSNSPKENEIFCQLWYEKIQNPIVLRAQVEDTGRGLTYSGKKYQERLYTCATPKVSLVPSRVSLTFRKCQSPSSIIPIYVANKTRQHKFGVCVAVAYDKLDPQRIIEWVEFNRLLGVAEFNIYNSSLSAEALKILQYYEKQGVVRLRQSAPPIEDWCMWCQKLATIAVLNDCLYRNMYRYDYIIVIDFDELIIPRRDLSYAELAVRLERSRQNLPGFIFSNAYFFLDLPPEKDDGDDAISMRYLRRLKPSPKGVASKSWINPRKCVILQNHYCMIRTPDVGKWWTEPVSPEVALTHHYRFCHLSGDACSQAKLNNVWDNISLRFTHPLRNRINKVKQDYSKDS